MPKEGGELTIEDLGQLFADFNSLLVKVSPKQANGLDLTNLYVQGGTELANESFIADHHPELTDRKKHQVALQHAVRVGCEGIATRKRSLGWVPPRPNLTEENYEHEIQALIGFFGQFAERLGPERWGDKDGVHISVIGLQALADVHFQMRHPRIFNVADRSAVLDVLGAVDWSRSNPLWQRVGVFVVTDTGAINNQQDAAGALAKYLSSHCFNRQLPLLPQGPNAEPHIPAIQ
jgi:hypothetical protein